LKPGVVNTDIQVGRHPAGRVAESEPTQVAGVWLKFDPDEIRDGLSSGV
jgi:hypothetical protein